MKRMMQCLLLAALGTTAGGQEKSIVRYLANEGVMITHGDTTILFDPLFADSYGQYQVVPQNVLDAIFAGAAPFDGVDAVFISHFHGDHFSASEVLRLLQVRREIQLYAPAQAVAEMRRISTSDDEGIFDRITIFDLDYGDAPVFVRQEGLLIEAVHVPHSGWPTARTDVQNITFRVTLEDTSTVLHLGDADARLVHFAQDQNYWDERRIDLAFPPYWFFLSDDGREILENRINIRNSIGIHVPARFGDAPSSVPDELLGDDLFTRPGEGRRFTGTQ
jgi:L-ascorbate metabolism protein UlaG (beta-lactamase superfamily)